MSEIPMVRAHRRLIAIVAVILPLVAGACGAEVFEPTALPAEAAATAEPVTSEPAEPTAVQPADAEPSEVVEPTAVPPADAASPETTTTATTTATATPADNPTLSGDYFATVAVGQELPDEAVCASLVRAAPRDERRPENAQSNATSGGPSVLIDGAHGFRGDSLSARVTGNFTGSTEDILRWAACKWGIDEELTRARAWTESSWLIDTKGDGNDNPAVCALIGLEAPCAQSYGLLQVKGTVHEGTYPYSFESTAWGVDYAMGWQRACFEGAFTWLNPQGYEAGDMRGCVGAWFSGEWYDANALRYFEHVDENLANQPWLS